MRKTRSRPEKVSKSEGNLKRILRPRLEFKHEEGFNGDEVKKALLESIYEKERQERRKAAELEKKKGVQVKPNKKKKKLKEKSTTKKAEEIPSTQDFIRFLSLDYTKEVKSLPEDIKRFRDIPLAAIPNPY